MRAFWWMFPLPISSVSTVRLGRTTMLTTVAKWLGRQSYLDDLASLDRELYKGLISELPLGVGDGRCMRLLTGSSEELS